MRCVFIAMPTTVSRAAIRAAVDGGTGRCRYCCTPIVPACDGALFVAVQVAAVPEPRQVDIFEWVEGRQLGLVEEGVADPAGVSEVYGTIGQLAARLHNQAIGWALPQEFTRHAWDVAGLVGEAPFWGPFWELASLTAEEKKLLLRARERARIDLTAYAGVPANDEYYSLIHADFLAENLMVDGETVRLIDFDDAGFGWHLFELATALYFEMEEDYYPQAYSALVAGYRQHRPLPDSQLEQLPLFLLVRSFTYLGWAHTRSETQTAQELVPMFTRRACALARDYLDNAASP